MIGIRKDGGCCSNLKITLRSSYCKDIILSFKPICIVVRKTFVFHYTYLPIYLTWFIVCRLGNQFSFPRSALMFVWRFIFSGYISTFSRNRQLQFVKYEHITDAIYNLYRHHTSVSVVKCNANELFWIIWNLVLWIIIVVYMV